VTLQTLLSITTIFLMMIAFSGVCWWAFAPRRKKRFEEAANLPFADETAIEKQKKQESE